MISDYKMAPKGLAARHVVAFPVPTTAVSQTALLAGAHTPGVRYQVTKVTVFATAVTATVTVDVQIGGVSVLTGQITPVAGSEVTGVLVSTQATLRGKASGAGSQLQVLYTSGAAGAASNLVVHVQVRPYPSFGEVA